MQWVAKAKQAETNNTKFDPKADAAAVSFTCPQLLRVHLRPLVLSRLTLSNLQEEAEKLELTKKVSVKCFFWMLADVTSVCLVVSSIRTYLLFILCKFRALVFSSQPTSQILYTYITFFSRLKKSKLAVGLY